MNDFVKLYRAYQSLITSIVTILIVVLGTVVGIFPAFRRIAQIREETDKLQAQVETLRKKALILEAIDEETYRKFLAELLTAVPADQSLTSVFSTVDGLAAQSGVTVTDLSLSKPGQIATESGKKLSTEEKKIGSTILPFAITISGTYDQIRGFFSQVASVRRIFRVRSFDFTLLDPTSISARIAMDAFYAPYITNVAAIDATLDALSEKDEGIIQTVANMPIVGVSTSIDGGQTLLAPTFEQKENPFEP